MGSLIIHKHSGEVLAHKYYGGHVKGPVLQMHLTPTEYKNYENEIAVDENGHEAPLHEIIRDVKSNNPDLTHVWDSAQNRNEIARGYEKLADTRWHNHPHIRDNLMNAADNYRNKARQAVRDYLISNQVK